MKTSTNSTESYFDSYGDLSVHELMLKDLPRTLAYKEFFEKNAALIKDKVVLDLGAGSGILSLFAAAVGAKIVYAVEASPIANMCKEIVKCNGYENVIHVYNCAVEDVELPEGTKIDVLVSEWMGFYLFHESMLDSVIYARDKYLSNTGIMAPSTANLYVAPTTMDSYHSEHIDYWKNAYGFNFSPFIEHAMHQGQKSPIIAVIKSNELLAKAERVIEFDLRTATTSDVRKISNTLNFKMDRSGILRGFACWFDVEFNSLEVDGAVCVLSTSPRSPPTHWKQTVFMLQEEFTVEPGDEIQSLVELAQSEENKRHYNICMELLDVEDDDSEDDEDHSVPCDCHRPKCRLIKKVMETYDEEHRLVEEERELTDVNAETEAAKVMDSETTLEDDDLDAVIG